MCSRLGWCKVGFSTSFLDWCVCQPCYPVINDELFYSVDGTSKLSLRISLSSLVAVDAVVESREGRSPPCFFIHFYFFFFTSCSLFRLLRRRRLVFLYTHTYAHSAKPVCMSFVSLGWINKKGGGPAVRSPEGHQQVHPMCDSLLFYFVIFLTPLFLLHFYFFMYSSFSFLPICS